MIPVLYPANATDFTTFGIGTLTDTLTCEVSEERNGLFECLLKYPVSGQHYDKIAKECIIKAKPNATPIVAILEWLPSWDSGISSSTTTYIIAPAEKASKNGNTGCNQSINNMVINPAKGSTMPEPAPYKNAFHLLRTLSFKGIDTIAPSGKF